MAETIAYAAGYTKHGQLQSRRVSRLGHGAAMAQANTWHTFTTTYVNADGSGYVNITRDGKTIHHLEFHAEDYFCPCCR